MSNYIAIEETIRTLDQTISSHPIISDTSIVPGMLNYEAVVFTIHPKA